MQSPVFLSFDGVDGTGKSTQVRLLVDWLRELGLPVTHCIDPGGTDLGTRLREILLHGRQHDMNTRAEALLFMASRAELVEKVIRPALARGEIVVSDRYLMANVVYQGHAGGLPPEQLRSIGLFATGGLLPDHTIVFDLPTEVAIQRRGRDADRMERKGTAYLDRVRRGFQIEAAALGNRATLLDASPEIEAIRQQVRAIVRSVLAAQGVSLPGGAA